MPEQTGFTASATDKFYVVLDPSPGPSRLGLSDFFCQIGAFGIGVGLGLGGSSEEDVCAVAVPAVDAGRVKEALMLASVTRANPRAAGQHGWPAVSNPSSWPRDLKE